MIEVIETSAQSQFDSFQIVEVVLQNSNTRLSINSLLPNFWSIVQSPNVRIHTDPDRKRVVIPNAYFSQPGNVFSLFHEIGHAIVDNAKSEMDIEEEIFLRDKYRNLGPSSLSDTERVKFQILVIDSEKSAWNWALKTINDYRKRKIDLEPSLSKNDMKKLANQKLASYLRKT